MNALTGLGKPKNTDTAKGNDSQDSDAPRKVVDGASESTEPGSNAKAEEAAEKAQDTVEETTNTPAFGKHGGGSDENDPLTESGQVEALQNQAEAASPGGDAEAAATILAVEQLQDVDSNVTIYSSSPSENYRVGRFQFEKGILRLDAEDAAEFDKIVEGLPPLEQNGIRKIDREAGEKVARTFLQTRMNSGIDTTANTDLPR